MKNWIKNEAKLLAAAAFTMKDINNAYGKLRERFEASDAKEIISVAKDLKRVEFAKVDEHKKSLVDSIDGNMVLRAVFAELKKDKDWKWLAGKAEVVAGSVEELVAKWYPDTIDGVPARKVWKDEAHTVKVWAEKPITKGNAAQILITSIRAIAKKAKRQVSGTTNHAEGELVK